MMAPVVFKMWGVRTTDDLGEIVFKLIAVQRLSKSDRDDPEDFHDLFDLHRTLTDGFELTLGDTTAKRGDSMSAQRPSDKTAPALPPLLPHQPRPERPAALAGRSASGDRVRRATGGLVELVGVHRADQEPSADRLARPSRRRNVSGFGEAHREQRR